MELEDGSHIVFESVMPGGYPTTRLTANVADESGAGDEQLTSSAATLAMHTTMILYGRGSPAEESR